MHSLKSIIVLLSLLLTSSFAISSEEEALNKLQNALAKQLTKLEKNHENTAKIAKKIDTDDDILLYIAEIDKRRNELHPSIAKLYNQIGQVLKKLHREEKALKAFQKGLTISYTILGNSNDISKTILSNATEGLTQQEAMKFEITIRRKALTHHKKNLAKSASTSKRYSQKIYQDYRNIIKVYTNYEASEKATFYYEESLTFFKKKYDEYPKTYAIEYAKIISNGVKAFKKEKQTLKEAKKILHTLEQTAQVKRLLLQIEALNPQAQHSNLILYMLITLLIVLVLALLYYFKIYHSPLVKQISKDPKRLLSLSPQELKKVKLNLQILLQWSDILRFVETTHEKVNKALAFYKTPSIENFSHLVQLKEYQQKESLYLFNNINLPLNMNRFFLRLSKDSLAEIKEKYLTGEHIFIISHPKHQDKIAAFTHDKNNNLIAPTLAELNELFLSKNPKKFLVKIFAKCLSFKSLSPYQTKGAIHLQDNFFGRSEIIRDITSKSSSNYFLIGARQLGKSSILKALERYYADNKQVECHYFSLEYGDILQELSTALKINSKSNLEEISSSIKAQKKKLIFLIDEADFLSERSDCMLISSTFRKLSQEGDAMFIFTGYWTLYQSITMNYHSPLKNFGELIHLGSLETQAAKELMSIPMQRIEVKYEEPSIIEQTIKRCGNRANLIAMVCNNALKNLHNNIITQENIETAFSQENIYSSINEWQGLSSDKKENLINRLIVYLTFKLDNFSLSDVIQLIKEQNIELTLEEIEMSLKQLYLGYVLKKERNHYGYQVPLIKEFLHEDPESTEIALERLIFDLQKNLKEQK